MRSKFRLSGSFSTKLTLAFLLVIMIPTLFTSVSFYWESDSAIKRNVRESTVQLSKQTAASLSFIFNVGIDTSDFIVSDPHIQSAAMSKNESKALDQGSNIQYIDTLLDNFVFSNSFVKIVYVFKEDGIGWGSGTYSNYRLKRIRVSDQEWVKEAKRRNGEMVWQGIQYDKFSGGGVVNKDLVVPVGRVLKDFDTLRNIGLVQIHLNGRSILNTIKQSKLGKTGKFFVVNQHGSYMIHSDLRLINKKVDNPFLLDHIVGKDAMEFEYKVNGVPYYGVKQLLSNGWMLVGTVPIHEISGQLDELKTNIMFSSGILGLFAVGIGLLIAGWVTGPVKQLSKSMLSVQRGDLTVRTAVNSSDEIGFLNVQFNKMLNQIEKLMQQVENEQCEKYHAELRAVTHRVHPHFLYNTLSTLRYLIESNQNERASTVLNALNHLLEANMGKSGNVITIGEELDIIRKYLVILELRYEKTFHLEEDIQPGLDQIPIPRMLLQPIVENAIFHGIVPKNKGGRISIRIHAEDSNLALIIQDDGLGIGDEKLKEFDDPESAIVKGEIGIGLRHVYDSLRLYYGQNWEWSISRGPAEGTQVRILLKRQVKTES